MNAIDIHTEIYGNLDVVKFRDTEGNKFSFNGARSRSDLKPPFFSISDNKELGEECWAIYINYDAKYWNTNSYEGVFEFDSDNNNDNNKNENDTLEVKIAKNTLDLTGIKSYKAEDKKINTYRPLGFDNFIGQEHAKKQAKLAIEMIKDGTDRHVFLDALKGHGKTTMARIIAKELDANLIEVIGQTFSLGRLSEILKEINESEKYTVFFLDEVDMIENIDDFRNMNSILEDFKINGINIKPFTMIIATVNSDKLYQHADDTMERFGVEINIVRYKTGELLQILEQYIKMVFPNKKYTMSDLKILAENCKFTPRVAIGLLKKYITLQDVEETIKISKIIKDGLTTIDVKVLRILSTVKRIGANALAQQLGIKEKKYISKIEPFLCEFGYMQRAPSRMITEKGKQFLNSLNVKGEV